MHDPTRPPRDVDRVAALTQYAIEEGDADLEVIARLAAVTCGTASASVNVMDGQSQHMGGTFRVQPMVLPREEAMCRWVVADGQPVHTQDASQDTRWRDDPLVDGTLAAIRRYAAAPIRTADGMTIGTVCAFDEEPGDFSDAALLALGDLAHQASRLLALRTRSAHFENLALHDPLTGLGNRRMFDLALDRVLARAARGRCVPGVAFIDLDRFKEVNDHSGHGVGDELLVRLAARIRGSVRVEDTAARLGGDEFAVVVDDGAPDQVNALAARLSTLLALPYEMGEALMAVEGSIGLSSWQAGDSREDFLRRADARMYEVKYLARRGAWDYVPA